MNRKIVLLIAAATLALATLSAFADTSTASPRQASKGALVALGKTALGSVLVDARGRTLYLFDKDKQARVPARAPVRRTGRRCSAPPSLGKRRACAPPCSA